ncbi:hypothetical protein A4X13_0g8795 [Tilletia indica]|uniref:Uncharacterized protein n=1 Tax=Tilletia indica TaxID=43049 RepID=A0A8T8SCY9_9BASI|nr:hypothetical protein A4X13_0g8795 [Tilletia indica]
MVIGLHFHTFNYPRHHGVHTDVAPWHVSTHDGLMFHRDYWNYYQGRDATRIPVFGDIVNTLTVPRIPTLRCISLDVRALEPISKSSLRLWKTLHAPRWVQTAMILTRIAIGSCGIEELNIRVSPQQDLLNIIQDIVERNKRLRIIRIDVDSTIVSNRNIRPTIRLDKMFGCYKTRVPLERLVIRAPGCNIKTWATSKDQQAQFFVHLRRLKELVLACHVFNALLPTVIWVYHLLRHMPGLELGDIAVHAADSHKVSMSDVDLSLLHMHALDKLSLQIPEVDTHLLRSINALGLYKLRIKSSVPVETWPACVENHFPNLFIANIMCPGPSALRIEALGVPQKWFYQNLGGNHNHTRAHNQPFLAYIKPYSRRRHEFSSPPASNPQPYRLPEACEMGWDEEDSEDTVTTGSDYPDSEDEDVDHGSSSSELSSLTELSDSASDDEPQDESEGEGSSSSDQDDSSGEGSSSSDPYFSTDVSDSEQPSSTESEPDWQSTDDADTDHDATSSHASIVPLPAEPSQDPTLDHDLEPSHPVASGSSLAGSSSTVNADAPPRPHKRPRLCHR